jgi:cell wall-associated NlpC family hydrolase
MKPLLIPIALLLATIASAQTSVKFIEQIQFTPSGNFTTASNDVQQTIIDKPQKPVAIDNSQVTTPDIESISRLQAKYAMLLNVEVESIKNIPLYSFINEWYGSPYQMGGLEKNGIDCSGFSCTLLRKVFLVNPPRTAKEQYELSDHVSKDKLKEGDLVFFNTFGGVSHVGVYLSNGHFVHASTNYGVIISTLDEGYYKQKFIGGGRIK